MIKRRNFSLLKTIFCSTLSLSALPVLFINNNNINNLNKVINDVDYSSLNNKATNFDYIPIANNVNAQPISTSIGFLGINNDNNILYLTSYEGVTVWKFDATKNNMVNQYYNNFFKISDISKFTLKSWKYIENKNVIALLFSDENSKYSTIFGINADTGLIYATNLGSDGNPIPESNMVSVNDGVNVLWLNSNDDIIASKFSNLNTYFWNAFTIKFDENGVSMFRTATRQQSAINMDDAKTFVTAKLNSGDSDVVNGVIYKHSDKGWMNSTGNTDGSSWKLQALIEGEYKSNTNIGIFTDESAYTNITQSHTGISRDGYLQQAVLLDDSLNAILGEDGKPIALTLNNPIAYDDANSVEGVWKYSSDMQKYGYKGTKEGSKQNFVWLTSGVFNAVNLITYDSQTKKITLTNQLDLQRTTDQDVRAYSYDVNQNRIFTTNSYTDSNTVIGYIDFDDQNISYKSLVNSNLDKPGMIDSILNFSPVVSNQSIIETPIVYFDSKDSSKINGLFFENGGQNATTINLTRKTYQDLETNIKATDWYKNKSASSISDEQLKSVLVFDGNPTYGNFSTNVVYKKSDDNNGTLNFKYETSYQNWWNQNTNSYFHIETTIEGMYATKNGSFDFVVTNNSNQQNNEILKKQIAYKEQKYPSNITYNDVLTYFAISSVKDISGNVITLTEDMVTLVPDNNNGRLTIKVDFTNKLPQGLSSDYLVYEHTFDGFKNSSDFSVEALSIEEQNNTVSIVNMKKDYFPSDMENKKNEILNYLLNINGYSKNVDDWTFKFVFDNFKGTFDVNLIYNSTSTPLPDQSIQKEFNFSFSGFRKIQDNFDELTIKSYDGYLTSDDIWNDYQNATDKTKTVLNDLINVENIDFNDLVITNNNTINNSLDLTIEIKPNSVSNLKVNNTNLVMTEDILNQLKNSGINYPFNLSISVNTKTQQFIFNKPNGEQVDFTSDENSTIYIDLNKDKYDSLSSSKYADQITVDDVKNLYSISGFAENISLQPNVQEGKVYVVINLIPASDITINQNNSTNKTIIKTIEISGFKKPSSHLILAISLTVVIAVIIIAIIIVVYASIMKKNLKKLLNNQQDTKDKKENKKW